MINSLKMRYVPGKGINVPFIPASKEMSWKNMNKSNSDRNKKTVEEVEGVDLCIPRNMELAFSTLTK